MSAKWLQHCSHFSENVTLMTSCHLSEANPSLLGNNLSKQPSFVLRNALYTLKTNERVTLNMHKCFQMGAYLVSTLNI